MIAIAITDPLFSTMHVQQMQLKGRKMCNNNQLKLNYRIRSEEKNKRDSMHVP